MRQYVLYIFLVFTAFIYAQSESVFTLKGSVKERYTNKAIPDVEVYIVGGAFTKTDFIGRFTIRAKIGDELVVTSNEIETVYYIINSKEDVDVKVEEYFAQEEILSYQQLLDSAAYYKNNNLKKSLSYIERSLKLSGVGNKEKFLSYEALADVYVFWKQYDLAIENYQYAIAIESNANLLIKKAKAYLLNGDIKNTKRLSEKILQNQQLSSSQNIRVNQILGDASLLDKNFDESLTYYNKALSIAQTDNDNKSVRTLTSKIADAYAKKGEVKTAEKFFTTSLQKAKKEGTEEYLQEQEKVADFYNFSQDYDKEIEIRNRNLNTLEKNNNTLADSIASPQKISYKIATAYLAKEDYVKAIPYLEKSIAEAQKQNDIVVQKDATRKLSEVYKSRGNNTEALNLYQKYVSLVDTLYIRKEQEISQITRLSRSIATQQSRIASLETAQQLQKSNANLAIKNEQLALVTNKRQNLIIYILIGAICTVLVIAYLTYRNNKQQRLANNMLALRSLRTQMNPHFIFNALNSVNHYVAVNDERKANKFIASFSALMRLVLENSEEDVIPLSKEIELLSLYARLEHSRFTDKFDYTFEVDPAIETETFFIPPMLLQPYVENAIWHGLRYKEDKGFLHISFQKVTATQLQIIVDDNGIGRAKSAAIKTKNQKKQKSKGMGNIEKRIAILNSMYKNKVSVTIVDKTEPVTGTTVIVKLNK